MNSKELTLANVIAWLREVATRDPNREFWSGSSTCCPVAGFLNAQLCTYGVSVGTFSYSIGVGPEHPIPSDLSVVIGEFDRLAGSPEVPAYQALEAFERIARERGIEV